MKLKQLINEYKVYCRIEDEVRAWVEKTYPGLTFECTPNRMEIVRTSEDIDYPEDRVLKIVEAVNLKIDGLLEANEEEIYISEKLTQIWKKHPRFNPEIESIEELKTNKKFLTYFKELSIKHKKESKPCKKIANA